MNPLLPRSRYINKQAGEPLVVLAGNPNVGKSTLFNALTGMNQHTGNWPGKTVATARGRWSGPGFSCMLVDVPGAYSLTPRSEEEEVAREAICFSGADAVIVVCDATCLERNLAFALQCVEAAARVVVCVNLIDEARRKGICVDCGELEKKLGVPVVFTSAARSQGLEALRRAVAQALAAPPRTLPALSYPDPVERAVAQFSPTLQCLYPQYNSRWLALRLLEDESAFKALLNDRAPLVPNEASSLAFVASSVFAAAERSGWPQAYIKDTIATSLVQKGADVYRACVKTAPAFHKDHRLDKFLTSKLTGVPVMLCLLTLIFYITIAGANYPSQLLSQGLFWVECRFGELLALLSAPPWLSAMLVQGMFRVLSWVIAVMLPPMAIFFPLFTLLEDFGYLPRVAFNLDRAFKRCSACGKQALTMCMGLGCNAAGVTGCRIIDSPRERLIAILTNSLVPCNGRFPIFIAIISMFFAAQTGSLTGALMLTGIILLGVALTLVCSKFLSKTVLRGIPSSFTLELPPFRKPRVGQVLVRSLVDRTLFVLGRAVAVAAPAGLIIWTLANVQAGGVSLLAHGVAALDPIGRFLGMDGVILMAFILGFPANELVLPLILMMYLSAATLTDTSSLLAMHSLLVANGWTATTALCTLLFALLHWPCSTTCITIFKETKSAKWTALAFLLPTTLGAALCALTALASTLL